MHPEIKVLVDSSVRHHAVEWKGVWEDEGCVMWGNVSVNTGRIVGKEIPNKVKTTKGGPQGRYIAALALAHRDGKWEAHTSDALQFETRHLPMGRLSGENYGDLSLFKDVRYFANHTLEGFSLSLPDQTSPIARLRQFLANQSDKAYLRISNQLSNLSKTPKSSQDAWHIHCVKLLGLQRFLTCDTILIGQVNSLPDKSFRRELQAMVVLPMTLCDELKLDKITDAQYLSLIDELSNGDMSSR